MIAGAYFVGREPDALTVPYRGQNKLFGGQRLDGAEIVDASYEHSTFANISFKNATIRDGHFLNCTFISCYFRSTQFRGTSFSACRFIDCEFPGASFGTCDFRYARFAGCYVDYGEIKHTLPQEPNLRETIAGNLAREAALLPDAAQARSFRLEQMGAHEQNLWGAVSGKSKWYRDHYDSPARVGAFLRLVASYINKVGFGYGERPIVLIRNYLAATLVIFPLVLYVVGGPADFSSLKASFTVGQALELSIHHSTFGAFPTAVTIAGLEGRLVAGFQSVLAAIWASLLASYVFRWSLHR